MLESLQKYIINNIKREESDIALFNGWTKNLKEKPTFEEAVGYLALIKMARDEDAFECLNILMTSH